MAIYFLFRRNDAEFLAFKKLGSRENNHLAFIASGNERLDLDCHSPAGRPSSKQCKHWAPASYTFPGLITVASSNTNGGKCEFSNVGNRSVHLFAPGDAIMSIDNSESRLSHFLNYHVLNSHREFHHGKNRQRHVFLMPDRFGHCRVYLGAVSQHY